MSFGIVLGIVIGVLLIDTNEAILRWRKRR